MIKKSLKKLGLISLVGVIGITMLTGCGSKEVADANGKEEIKTISVIGSTSVTPVAQELVKAFEEKNPNIRIDVQGVGSTAGVKAANDGIGEIGMASRELKSGEKDWGLAEHVIAYDGIAVVVNPKNSISNISQKEIKKIFSGEITNWKEVGGEDREILVISREAGSGTRGAFEGLNSLQEKNTEGKKVSIVREDALIAEGNGAVKANVASKEYAIGYVSLSYMDKSIKSLSVDLVQASVENIGNGSYKIARPFIMVTKGQISKEAKGYLEFIMSEEGQAIVGKKLIKVK